MRELDELPLEVLVALHQALCEQAERARRRERDEGRWSVGTPRVDRRPIEMEEAPEGVESLTLRFRR